MNRRAPAFLLPFTFIAVTALTTACSGGGDSDSDTEGPARGEETRVIFNPAAQWLPTPNDLMFEADGTLTAGDEPGNPVVAGIDALDGNSVLAPFDIQFSGRLDDGQALPANSFVALDGAVLPNPEQKVFLLPLSYPGGDPLVQARADVDGDGDTESAEVPTFSGAAAYQRAAASGDQAALMKLASPSVRAEVISLDGGTDNVLRITPLEPLMPETRYLVIVTNGVTDAAGHGVYPSHSYNFIRDPESPLAAFEGLPRLRDTVNNWESLATGYFGFMQAAFNAADSDFTAPSEEDIVFTMTFTTGGTRAALTSLAAPEIYLAKNLRTNYKHDAIAKLTSGVYNLQGDNSNLTEQPTDAAINSTLHFLLTSATLPDQSPNPLYKPAIASAIAAGADYRSLASDASAAHLMQRAAAQAAVQVHNSGAAEQGDQPPYVTIAAEAQGGVAALSDGNPTGLFPMPAPRETTFFRVDSAAALNPALAAPAKVYQGEITLPYYQPLPEPGDGSALTQGNWISQSMGGPLTAPSDMITYRYPFPEQRGSATLPLLATLPDAQTLANFGISKPAEGWPVIIYVHGIGADRSASLPMADALAFACIRPDGSAPTDLPCFATVAIDQPLHGVAPSGSTVPGLVSATDPDVSIAPNLPVGAPATPSAELTERHFDFTADAQSNPIPMDYATNFGRSGSLFINLTHFTNARDNLQQMVMDLLNLNSSLATMDVDGDGLANDLDPNRVYLVGHSLGAIAGIPFAAVNNHPDVQSSPFNSLPPIQAAALLNTGGGLPRLLIHSPALAPDVLQGLAAASSALTQGQGGLETYLNVFQGVLDSVDAMNFAAALSDEAAATGILLTEIVGDGSGDNPPDQTIPNAADTRWGESKGPLDMVLDNGFTIAPLPAPLAGTEPLVAQFNATPTAEASGDGDAAVLISRFSEGSHSTPVTAGNTDVDPLTSPAVFAEMVSQIAQFFAADGTVSESIVTNPEVMAD